MCIQGFGGEAGTLIHSDVDEDNIKVCLQGIGWRHELDLSGSG
jgi:hypothetical protein